MQRQLLVEHEKSKEEGLSALQNANEDKRRTINEFQMRIQDLTTQLKRLEVKVQEDLLEQKLQLEKEHLVRRDSRVQLYVDTRCSRIKSTI